MPRCHGALRRGCSSSPRVSSGPSGLELLHDLIDVAESRCGACCSQSGPHAEALFRHTGWCAALRHSEPPVERGVGVPSSRSLATASREAISVYGYSPRADRSSVLVRIVLAVRMEIPRIIGFVAKVKRCLDRDDGRYHKCAGTKLGTMTPRPAIHPKCPVAQH